jgi:hypothetical protein
MQQYVFMRTTLELPDDLLRRAKIAAIERGTTLRELIGKALAQELGVKDSAKPKRATFPIFASKTPGTLDLTAADLAGMDAEEDRRQHGLAH